MAVRYMLRKGLYLPTSIGAASESRAPLVIKHDVLCRLSFHAHVPHTHAHTRHRTQVSAQMSCLQRQGRVPARVGIEQGAQEENTGEDEGHGVGHGEGGQHGQHQAHEVDHEPQRRAKVGRRSGAQRHHHAVQQVGDLQRTHQTKINK